MEREDIDMNSYIVRELNSGRLISYIDSKIHYANHIGNAIKFPTEGEADNYIKENGLDWYNFGVEKC
jgi:hypothetical protein